MLRIEDLTENNLDDVFNVCSYGRLDDPLQIKGIALKTRWLIDTLEKHGSCTKIAYLNDRPVAQILYFPEELAPSIADPREGVVALHCAYNPFSEARGRGAGKALMGKFLAECDSGLKILSGKTCSFVVARPYTTGVGLPLGEFYSKHGFLQGEDEVYFEVRKAYRPRATTEYDPLPEDRGRAFMFYEPVCEWGYPFAVQVKDYLRNIDPDLPIKLINSWEEPDKFIKRGSKQLIVNATEIKSFWTEKESFRREVEEALRR